MPLSRRRVTDPATLRVLAHPVRLALLDLLVSGGAHTATQAAEVLGQTPSNCSWHLRKLAAHGFVREVSDVPGRHRPWRVVSEGLPWGDSDDEGAAHDAVTDLLVDRELQRLRASRAAAASEPVEWRGATAFHHAPLRLTAAQARELDGRMAALVGEYAGPSEHPDARPVSLVAWLAPTAPAPGGGATG